MAHIAACITPIGKLSHAHLAIPRHNPSVLLLYLEGQGDLVSRLITPRTHIVILIIPVINHLLSPPDPLSNPGQALEVKRGKTIPKPRVCARAEQSENEILGG